MMDQEVRFIPKNHGFLQIGLGRDSQYGGLCPSFSSPEAKVGHLGEVSFSVFVTVQSVPKASKLAPDSAQCIIRYLPNWEAEKRGSD